MPSRCSDRLQGVISFHDDAMPICGLRQSSSPIPTARSLPRAAARSRPSVTMPLCGLRWVGCVWLLDDSLLTPASKKMIANNQMFPHLIFFGKISFCGIRRSLRFVTNPPNTSRTGKIHGDLNNRKVAIALITRITRVIVLWTEMRYARCAAKARKPIVIGAMKRNTTILAVGKKENNPISTQAGNVQINKVMIASTTPPRLYPISVSVCVDDAPGSS